LANELDEKSDSKNRYSLQEVQNIPSGATALESWRIRANQGHSLASVSIPMHTIPIQEYPFVIHGTFPESMPDILATGLSRMTRQHIHFIPPGREELLRGGCSVCIVVDLNKAIADGIVFYRSDNGVVLTEGKEGRLDKMYFRRVEERDGESVIWTPDE
jgi:2'-phosphotransferase